MVYISLMMQVMSIKITCILTLGNIAIIFLSGFIFHILLFTQEEEKALRVSSQKGMLLLFLFLFLFVCYIFLDVCRTQAKDHQNRWVHQSITKFSWASQTLPLTTPYNSKIKSLIIPLIYINLSCLFIFFPTNTIKNKILSSIYLSLLQKGFPLKLLF